MPRTAPGPARRPGSKILLVDDEQGILFAIRDYLSAQGYRVDCVREAHAAAVRLDATDYALVITDLRLTGTSGKEGFDVIDHARKRLPRVRTVLLTAYGTPEIEKEAREHGIDVVLHKPVPLSEVGAVVFELLHDHALSD
jgi:two-component system response regulator (stage 0 sporulation protein F)